MSDEIETLAPEARPMLARRFDSVDMELDGRNVYLRCAPYEVPATVMDPPDWVPYEESFARGAFDGALRDPQRVYLEHEHFAPGLSGVIGRGAELESRDDALYGRFRVLKGADGDKALELIADKVLAAASVFFAPIKSARTASGMVRLKVKLDRVALCREGAYPGAEVLAVRSGPPEPEEIVEERYERLSPPDPEMLARLSAQGITIPHRLAS